MMLDKVPGASLFFGTYHLRLMLYVLYVIENAFSTMCYYTVYLALGIGKRSVYLQQLSVCVCLSLAYPRTVSGCNFGNDRGAL